MSAARNKGTSRGKARVASIEQPFADDWWALDVPTAPIPDHPDAIRRRRARALRGRRFRVGRRFVALMRERHSVSPRFRRVVAVLIALLVAACAFALSVGVIVLNNVVISRSAELGRLDSQRTELRTENAQLNAQIATLSAPPRIVRAARKRLGMSEPTVPTHYVWLLPANERAALAERKRMARRIARQERLAQQQDVQIPVYSGPDVAEEDGGQEDTP